MSIPEYVVEPAPGFPTRHRVLRNGVAVHTGTEPECAAWLQRRLSRDQQDNAVRRAFGYA